MTEKKKFWTAEEFLRLTPAEQDELFEASIVWNLDDAPKDLVARMRASVQDRIDRTESSAR